MLFPLRLHFRYPVLFLIFIPPGSGSASSMRIRNTVTKTHNRSTISTSICPAAATYIISQCRGDVLPADAHEVDSAKVANAANSKHTSQTCGHNNSYNRPQTQQVLSSRQSYGNKTKTNYQYLYTLSKRFNIFYRLSVFFVWIPD